jgi:YD repeat-containing protein
MLGMDQASPVESKTLFTYASGSLRKELQNIYSYTYDSEGRITTVTNTQTTYSNDVPVQSYIVEKLEYAYKQQ